MLKKKDDVYQDIEVLADDLYNELYNKYVDITGLYPDAATDANLFVEAQSLAQEKAKE